ncbi:integrase arm-type DNA-binding domain-containing protein [Sulfurimonas sp.]|uniref:tyrosine-type recombinase/integrase n=1 Tax=Sulfurimonas sp. TaxID=2022749 RepID=UPI0025DE40B4|nr:integrase arm-type DNA-binding domain-containing protein [Sulfurimonas sp.]MDD5158111.1 integrase arm-type DNA-binding domain-containing protein [Sulfurimonas sp.]
MLTATQVKTLKPKDKLYTVNDGAGLSLEITPQGSKRWRFRYRFNNKPMRKSFGVYPDVSLARAREKRDAARTAIADGIDPFIVVEETIQTEVSAKTFKEWSEYYMDKVANNVSETHLVRSLKGWKKDVYPEIGDMLINDIKPKDIIRILNNMSNRGAKESAKKTFSSISRVYDVAIANYPDEVELNPCKSVSLKDVVGSSKTNNYPIITGDKELGILLNLIEQYPGHISTKLALKLIAHTFVRPINMRYAEWDEINLKAKQWIIPAAKMKTNKELIVPMSKQSIEIIKEAKENSTGSKFLFPSPRGQNTPLSDAAMVAALRRIGYTKDEIVAHSFRGIFSTIAHEHGRYTHDVIETQLAHTVGSKVSQAYNRALYLKERTEMMDWYSNHLDYIMSAVKKL